MTQRFYQLALLVLATVFIGGCDPIEWPGSPDKPEVQAALTPEQEAQVRKHVDTAEAHYNAADYDAAMEALVKALRLDNRNPGTLIACGDVFRKQDDYGKAKTMYVAACKADAYSFPAHYKLGITYQGLADMATESITLAQEYLQGAVTAYVRATHLDPKSFDAYLNLGTCYFQLDRKSLALQTTRKAIELNPRNYQAYSNYGLIAEYMGDYDAAISAYKSSLELHGSQPQILLNLASAHMRKGNYQSAMNTLRHSVALTPESPEAWLYLGVCYFRQKLFPEAIDAFQNAIRNDPKQPGAYRGLGVICMYKYVADRSRTDLRDTALKAWEYSLQLDPSQDDLRQLVAIYSAETKSTAPTQVVETTPETTPAPAPAPAAAPAPAPAAAPTGDITPLSNSAIQPLAAPAPAPGE